MAKFSRSPSPIHGRNPSPLRKSVDLSSHGLKFSSPSDPSRKSIGFKQVPSEKENEQDPSAFNLTKGRSPVMTSSLKGASFQKNFMASTISASSKAVVPPFQRKRVLGERNEEIKSSHASAQTDEIVEPTVGFSLASTQVGETQNFSDKSSFTSPQIKEIGSLSEHCAANIASPQVRSKIATQPDQSDSAPLPPYDPKVNYLSPRPQFLHYKPKPQADLSKNEPDFLNSDPRNLEDIFSSESSDDAIPVETEEENNLLEETTLPQIDFPKAELLTSRIPVVRTKLKIGHVLLALLIGCICCLPILAFYSGPKVIPVNFVGYHAMLLEVSKLNGWLPEYFSYPSARQPSFLREMNIIPWANLTCSVDEISATIDGVVTLPRISRENKIEMANKQEEMHARFDMIQRENDVSAIQAQYEIDKIEEEEEKEMEADGGSASEEQEMTASSTIPKMIEDTQPEKLEKSEPEKPKIPELELVENLELKDPEPIIRKNLEPELLEAESDHMSDEPLIKISKRAAQGLASVAVLLSLVTAVGASAFAKRKQNQVLDSDPIYGDKAPGLVHDSSGSHVPNRISFHQNSTLDTDEFSCSSFEVRTDSRTYTSTPCERQARRDSEASSCSYGSYMSVEKVSSKKLSREEEEMTPVRRSRRLRNRTILNL